MSHVWSPSTERDLSRSAKDTGHASNSTDNSIGFHSPVERIAVVIGWLAVIAFAVVTVVSGMLGGKVFAATDMMLRSPAYWQESEELPPLTNIVSGDTIDAGLPRAIEFTERLWQGDFAEWNPYIVGGEEFGGLPNTGLLTPLSAPLWLLPGPFGPAIVKLLEIGAVALGMSLFLRRLKLPRVTYPIATLAYVASGFMIAWTNWPQTRVAAMIPLVFWATERLITERRWVAAWPLIGALGCMWLGGFPAITFHTLYATCAYAVVRSLTTLAGQTAASLKTFLLDGARYALGVVGSLAIAAFTLLPFYLNSKELIDFSSRNARGSHLPFEALGSAILPYILGTANLQHYSGVAHPVEGLSYIGVAVLVCALVAIAFHRRFAGPRPILYFFVAFVLICGGAVYFGGPLLDAIQMLPTMTSSIIGRLRAVVGFGMAVLAAMGVAIAVNPRMVPSSRRDRPSLLVVTSNVVGWAVAALFVWCLVDSARAAFALTPDADWSGRWVKYSLVMLGAVIVILAMAMIIRRQWAAAFASIGVVALVAIPGALVAKSWWPQSSTDSFYPDRPAINYLEKNVDGQRFVALEGSIPTGVASAYGIRDLLGHAFMTQQWKDVLTAVYPAALVTPTYPSFPATESSAVLTSPLLDRFAVEYMVLPGATTLPGALELASSTDAKVTLDATQSVKSEVQAGPMRGVELRAVAVQGVPAAGVEFTARVLDPQGNVLTETSQDLRKVDGDTFIALNGDEFSPDQQWQVEFETSSPGTDITFGGSDADHVAIDILRPADDGGNVVETGNVTIVKRERALPRIHWASEAEVISDGPTRIARLNSGDLPAKTVVLESADAETSIRGNSTASLTVDDSGDLDDTHIGVVTTGPGWVVISDSMRRSGWEATIDGQSADIVAADHAGAAVFVPTSGSHEIVLT